MTMNITKAVARLPSVITIEGVNFIFELCSEDSNNDSVSICYQLLSCNDKTSKQHYMISNYGTWQNPYTDNSLQRFLYLVEHISDDVELEQGLENCFQFLNKNNLI